MIPGRSKGSERAAPAAALATLFTLGCGAAGEESARGQPNAAPSAAAEAPSSNRSVSTPGRGRIPTVNSRSRWATSTNTDLAPTTRVRVCPSCSRWWIRWGLASGTILHDRPFGAGVVGWIHEDSANRRAAPALSCTSSNALPAPPW